MQKTKLMVNGRWLMVKIIASLAFMLFLAQPAYATVPQVTIAQLPGYVTVDHFKLSCTALEGTTAQFFYRKDDWASFTSFGPAIDLTVAPFCLVEVTSSQIDSQTKYFFRVEINGGASSETSTIYDVSGPDSVRDYSKDKVGPTTYRIHWTNPGNSDFYQVFIYRGEASDFSANDSAKVTGIAGAPNANMSWDDNGVSSDKTYYYIIRALDKAGNSSGLVGDSQTTFVLGTTAPSAGQAGQVQVLPKEKAVGGEVLPQSTQEAEKEGTVEDFGETGSKVGKVLTGAAILAVLAGGIWYFVSKRKRY